MFFAANNADAVKTKMSGGSGGGVNMVRPGTTESEQGVEMFFSGVDQVVFLFAPFVAAKLRVNQVIAFDVKLNVSLFKKDAV